MTDALLDQLQREMRAAAERSEVSRISRNDEPAGKHKPLDDKGFPGFPEFPGAEIDGPNSGFANHRGPGADAGARAGASARVHEISGNPGNPGNANTISGVLSLSISQKERESGKSGKSWPPADLIAPGICREDILSLYEERAAIREFDGGMTRRGAEAAAVEDVRQALREGRIARDPPPPPTGQ